MKELRSKKGITLIALVITIIVLLILAAVSISAIVSDNGIIKRAEEAKVKTIEGKEKEYVDLAYASILAGSTTKEMTEEEQIEALKKELKNLAGDDAVTVGNNGDGTLIITFKETGKVYPVDIVKSSDDETEEDINKTLDYFTFDESTRVLTSKGELIGSYRDNRTFPVNVAVFPKEINGVPVEGIESFEGLGLLACSEELEKVIILAEIDTIGEWDYYDCTNLTSIEIPDSVTTIENHAFDGCTGLTSITIPDSVTSIGVGAFSGCTSLTSITIPSSVTSMGGAEFYGCTGLTSIEIPDSVTSIGTQAFQLCTGLTSIEIPDSVTSIGNYAFSGCTSLTSITIPDSVTSIGTEAFKGCTGLTSVTIPDSVTSIGSNAFSGCTGLTSITIPSSVTSIGNYAFFGCTGLTSIKVDEANTTYDSGDNCNAIIETATNTLIVGCKTTTIPGSVTTIRSSAFYGCTGLTSVTIPNSVTSIGNWAFYGCTDLAMVVIPDSVTSIGTDAFYNVPCISYSGTATGSPWGALSVE